MDAFGMRSKLSHNRGFTYDGFFEVHDSVYVWRMKDRSTKHLKNMTESHIKNTIDYLNRKYLGFELDYEEGNNQKFYLYQRTIEILNYELLRRKEENDLSAEIKHAQKKEKKETKKQVFIQELPQDLPSNVLMLCGCGEEYTARKSDLKRGWGRSCSKKCAFKAKNGLQGLGVLK